VDWNQYERECYLLARYEKKYLNDRTFDIRVQTLLGSVKPEDAPKAISIMEQMVSHAPPYYEADKRYAPILIYKSEPICYGILNHFADCMKTELENLGETVEIFDSTTQPLENLIDLTTQTYKAVLGIQSYFFSIQLQNGELLHDRFQAPLYNMQLDHPCVMHKHLINAPRNLTMLTHDVNYERYLKTYYGDKVRAELLAPGGEICERFYDEADKQYDLTFVGSDYGFTDWIPELKELNRKTHGFVRKLVHEMKQHSNDTYEACFERILSGEHLNYSLEQKREAMYEWRAAGCCVRNFYRQKIVKAILDAGIELHVYGDSWKKREWAGYSNLKIHEELEGSAVMDIYAKSRISLNVMSWHKAGMTERIANMMLSKTVVLTDKSDYLTEHFTDGTDIVFFDREQLEHLPETIKSLLADESGRRRIAEAGYQNALEHHTWRERAQQFLSMLPNAKEGESDS
jgi:hypothetical protein